MKVLIALSGLSIGGVETHALLLAKELKNEGNEVTLLSSGGVLQARCDLPHVCAPMISRRVGDMIRSARILFALLQILLNPTLEASKDINLFLLAS